MLIIYCYPLETRLPSSLWPSQPQPERTNKNLLTSTDKHLQLKQFKPHLHVPSCSPIQKQTLGPLARCARDQGGNQAPVDVLNSQWRQDPECDQASYIIVLDDISGPALRVDGNSVSWCTRVVNKRYRSPQSTDAIP